MVFETVRSIICEQLALDEDEVSLISEFYEDLNADSLDLVDISMAIYDKLGVWIPDEDLEKFNMVVDLVSYVDGGRTHTTEQDA